MDGIIPRDDGVGLPALRDGAIEALTNAYAGDAISLDEYEKRVGAVQIAESRGDVEACLAGVESFRDTTPPYVQAASDSESIRCNRSSMSVRDSTLLTKRLDVEIDGGALSLDYRNIALPAGIYEVHIVARGGYCRIRVPDGARIENRIRMDASSVSAPWESGNGNDHRIVIRLSGDVSRSHVHISRPVHWKRFFSRLIR
ncbi:MAG: hypothetical protein CVV47_01880 [Spirochaetae bacterium HGW-Spirochaetae-3]|jgi:hypothetical protein|nr:MAG: hypothetical protein CVV47_01880 [Spirochaetae bacterium HGW-Spirochaetae-3]